MGSSLVRLGRRLTPDAYNESMTTTTYLGYRITPDPKDNRFWLAIDEADGFYRFESERDAWAWIDRNQDGADD